MSKHLQRDMENLKKELLSLCSMVEAATNKAILALVDRRPELAQEVLHGDEEIDRKEVKVEEDCLKILALHQPVAADLRFIITALKVNNDLERIGDLAINISERAEFLSGQEILQVPVDLTGMTKKVHGMVRRSLDALINLDADLAWKVLREDDEVDATHKEMFEVIQKMMKADPSVIERAVAVLSTSRNLERIADQATNIAEDVIFMIQGDIIRHQEEPV